MAQYDPLIILFVFGKLSDLLGVTGLLTRGVLGVLHGGATNMIPRSFGVDKNVHFDLDTRIPIYASKGDAMNLAVMYATNCRPAFCAERHGPAIASFVGRKVVLARGPLQ